MKIKESLYLGIDLGTTHIKAVAYNKFGEIKGIARMITPTHVTKDGGIHHIAEEIWTNTIGSIQECLDQIQNYKVKGIGIASAAEAGVLLDENGDSTGPILAWYDERPNRYMEQVKSKVSNLEFYKKTGLYPKAKYSLMKFLWMKEHEPEQWRKGRSWLHLAEYIAYRLTGIKRSEITLASRTMLFNIKDKEWDKDIIKKFNINPDILQTVIQSGEKVGGLLKESSEILRMTEGIPVTIAGHDHIVGAFGIGGIHDGDIINSCGTAESLVATISDFDFDNLSEIPEFTIGCHVVTNRYYLILPVGTTGGITEWFLNMMKWDYEDLMDALSIENKYSSKLVFMPSPMGDSSSDVHTQTAWFGGAVTHAHSNQFATAMIQGLSCLFNYQIEYLKRQNVNMERLLVIGGSTKNKSWMQMKADVLDKTLQIFNDSEGVARGAAIMAAKISDGLNEIPVPSSYSVFPDADRKEEIQDFYKTTYIENLNLIKNMNI